MSDKLKVQTVFQKSDISNLLELKIMKFVKKFYDFKIYYANDTEKFFLVKDLDDDQVIVLEIRKQAELIDLYKAALYTLVHTREKEEVAVLLAETILTNLKDLTVYAIHCESGEYCASLIEKYSKDFPEAKKRINDLFKKESFKEEATSIITDFEEYLVFFNDEQ